MRSGRVRVGVIGGAGYIGSHTALALSEAGHQVLILDNLSTGNAGNLKPIGAQFFQGNLEDPILDDFLSSGIDAIFHFAALKAAGDSMIQPETYSSANIRASQRIIEKLHPNNVKLFVFSSSAAVYGDPQYLPVDEKHPLVPVNYYGFTKKSVEENLAWFSRLRDIRFASLRYFNAAGFDPLNRITGIEKNTANLLPLVMEVAAGKRQSINIYGNDYDTRDGTCVRDYVHVSDLASAHVLALDYIAKEKQNITVNLGSENGMTVTEMIETARKISGRPIPANIVGRRPGDPPASIASSKLAQEKLGWRAKYSAAESIIDSMWKVYQSAK